MLEEKVIRPRMLCWILIAGGLLIMMGQHDRSEALFYYFRLEDQVPEHHLLRLIDKHISFEFVRQQLKDSYSETGRPSIDPELLLRILLIGYLYGITSERQTGGGTGLRIWRGAGSRDWVSIRRSRTTLSFSENRHGRFQESKLFEELFEQIVRQCIDVGLVQGKHLSVDGSFVEANAAKASRIPRQQLAGSSASEPNRAPVPDGTGAAESYRRARASAGPRYRPPTRTRPLRHERRHAGAVGLLR